MHGTGGNNGDGDGPNRPIPAVLTAAEQQAKLTEATQLLVHRGFPASMFTVHNLNDHRYEVDQFLNLIKPLSSIQDNLELAHTLLLAAPRYWCAPDLATFPNLIKFVTWLETDAGRAKLNAQQKSQELKGGCGGGGGGGGGSMSSTDVAVVVRMQLTDYTASQKRLRDKFEAETSELRRKIRVLEDEMKAELEGLRSQFWPMAYYEPPTQAQVEVAAYDLYLRDAPKKKLSCIARGDEGYAKSIELFGCIARGQHMENWINEGDRKKVLMDYGKRKALYLKRIGETKQADKLRSLVSGGEEALNAGGTQGGSPDDQHSQV